MSIAPTKNSTPSFRYIFFGTPDFSARILRRLVDAGMAPVAVVTAPDEPAGRKQMITPPPAKVAASMHGLPVLQPDTVRSGSFVDSVKAYAPDLFVVVAYGKILPKDLLAVALKGALNVHPSLLPRWRGPAPIQYALLSGDEETGVSIMLLDEEMDHGPVLAQKPYPIRADDTAATLHETLADLGGKLLIDTLSRWVSGRMEPEPQDHAKATFSHIVKKADGDIDWTCSAQEIERKVRAFTPWPGAYTWFSENGNVHRLRILKAQYQKGVPGVPGSVIKTENKKIAVRCGKSGADLLMLDSVQPENKSPMDGYAFSLGHSGIFESPLRSHSD